MAQAEPETFSSPLSRILAPESRNRGAGMPLKRTVIPEQYQPLDVAAELMAARYGASVSEARSALRQAIEHGHVTCALSVDGCLRSWPPPEPYKIPELDFDHSICRLVPEIAHLTFGGDWADDAAQSSQSVPAALDVPGCPIKVMMPSVWEHFDRVLKAADRLPPKSPGRPRHRLRERMLELAIHYRDNNGPPELPGELVKFIAEHLAGEDQPPSDDTVRRFVRWLVSYLNGTP